jgi:hypothetical protein
MSVHDMKVMGAVAAGLLTKLNGESGARWLGLGWCRTGCYWNEANFG